MPLHKQPLHEEAPIGALSDVKQANLAEGMGSSGATAAFAQDGVEARTLPSPVLFEQAR